MFLIHYHKKRKQKLQNQRSNNNIRQKAIENRRKFKEITLKAKLMKLEPKIELAKQYDEDVKNETNILVY